MKTLWRLVVAFLLSSALLAASLPGARASQAAITSPFFMPSYAAQDYIYPDPTIDGCDTFTDGAQNWGWLQDRCWNSRAQSAYATSGRDLFVSDLNYIKANHLGTIQHIWFTLDSLFANPSSPTTSYTGFDPRSLADLDDMLSILHNDGMQADLVIEMWTDNHAWYYFNPQALDGNHNTLRSEYLQAFSDFVRHVAANPVDAATVKVIDLQAEVYYQLEQYFCGGYCGGGNPTYTNLGRWYYREPATCGTTGCPQCLALGNTYCTGGKDGYGCMNQTMTSMDTTCVDVNIIYPWVRDLYAAAHRAAASLTYTFSDTMRLLTTSTGRYTSQGFLLNEYPEDVIAEHFYEATPWDNTRHPVSAALAFTKPWYADDIGCDTNGPMGPTTCTYIPSANAAIYLWDLQHLSAYGAQSVIVDKEDENHREVNNLWSYVVNTGVIPHTYTYAPTANTANFQFYATHPFTNTFDLYDPGSLPAGITGSFPISFTDEVAPSNMSIVTSPAFSGHAALSIDVLNGQDSYLDKHYATGDPYTANAPSFVTHGLSFMINLGSDFGETTGGYLFLGQARTGATNGQDTVSVVMAPTGRLYLAVRDDTGAPHYVFATGKGLGDGTRPIKNQWHKILVYQQDEGGNSVVSLYLDGVQVARQSGLNLGSAGVTWFAVGAVGNAGAAGHIYLDDILTSSSPP